MSQDGFGIRSLAFDPDGGDAVEILTFGRTLATDPDFGVAVGERVARLARVRHTMYARARRIERPAENALLLYSDHVPGWRLSDALDVVEREHRTLDISTVIALLRQLIPAVALFSRHQRDATIGTVGPERLILTPQGRLVIAEYVLAPGIEQLMLSRERLWRDLRVAVPHATAPARLPPSADVVGIGVVGLSLLMGRRLRDDEYLVSLGDLFDALTETSAGRTRKLSPTFCTWLARLLQFDTHSYQSTHEAHVAFEELLAKERAYVTSAAELNQFLGRLEGAAGHPPSPSSMPVAAPPPRSAPAPTPIAPAAVESSIAESSAAPPISLSTPPPRARVESPAPAASAPSIVEAATPVPASADAASVPRWRRYAVPALVSLVVIEAALIGWLATREGASLLEQGELLVQSRPVAARVTIDGEERGVTPFAAALSPGAHVLEVRVGRSEPRVIPVMIRAGVQTGMYVELQSVATVGGLDVRTDPPKAQVTLAGQERGVTPLVLRDLPPGDVEVVVRLGGREVRQTVRIEPGITSQLVVPLGR